MIPFHFHFTYFRGATDWKWTSVHTLCILSCHERAKAERIIVHYDKEGDGPAWEEVRTLPYVEWRKVSPNWEINGHAVTDQRIAADYFRLTVLESEGGFYCDLDFVFLKSFEPLRHHTAIIGTQCPQKHKLACGLMGAVPGSTFIQAYRDAYKYWNPSEQKKFWNFANIIPYTLSKLHPITVLPRKIFYPLAWSNKTFWAGKPVCLKDSVAIHLWNHLNPDMSKASLMKSGLADAITEIYNGIPPTVSSAPGKTLSFE
jgi:hypothetical protein